VQTGAVADYHIEFIIKFHHMPGAHAACGGVCVEAPPKRQGFARHGSAASQPIANWLTSGPSPGKACGSVPNDHFGVAISHTRVSWDDFWEECEA
jgi:hypothetical protein